MTLDRPRAGDGTDAGVVERLHDAAVHAAQAVLYDPGLSPTSHGHVRQQFGQHVVLEGDASRASGRLLGRLYDHRRQADDDATSPDVDTEALCAEVDAFVDRMAERVHE